MVRINITKAQISQHANSADSQNDFLAKANILPAAIKLFIELTVLLRVLGGIDVKEIDRNYITLFSEYIILPKVHSICTIFFFYFLIIRKLG